VTVEIVADMAAVAAADVVVPAADAVATVAAVVAAAVRGEVKPNANAKKTQIPQSYARITSR
jgi:hypothetical protein